MRGSIETWLGGVIGGESACWRRGEAVRKDLEESRLEAWPETSGIEPGRQCSNCSVKDHNEWVSAPAFYPCRKRQPIARLSAPFNGSPAVIGGDRAFRAVLELRSMLVLWPDHVRGT